MNERKNNTNRLKLSRIYTAYNKDQDAHDDREAEQQEGNTNKMITTKKRKWGSRRARGTGGGPSGNHTAEQEEFNTDQKQEERAAR